MFLPRFAPIFLPNMLRFWGRFGKKSEQIGLSNNTAGQVVRLAHRLHHQHREGEGQGHLPVRACSCHNLVNKRTALSVSWYGSGNSKNQQDLRRTTSYSEKNDDN